MQRTQICTCPHKAETYTLCTHAESVHEPTHTPLFAPFTKPNCNLSPSLSRSDLRPLEVSRSVCGGQKCQSCGFQRRAERLLRWQISMLYMLCFCPWGAAFCVCVNIEVKAARAWRSELSWRSFPTWEVCFGLWCHTRPGVCPKALLVVVETQNNPCDASTVEDWGDLAELWFLKKEKQV